MITLNVKTKKSKLVNFKRFELDYNKRMIIEKCVLLRRKIQYSRDITAKSKCFIR